MRIDSSHAYQSVEAQLQQAKQASTETQGSQAHSADGQLSVKQLVSQVRQLPEVDASRVRDVKSRLDQLVHADAAIAAADAIVAELEQLGPQRPVDILA